MWLPLNFWGSAVNVDREYKTVLIMCILSTRHFVNKIWFKKKKKHFHVIHELNLLPPAPHLLCLHSYCFTSHSNKLSRSLLFPSLLSLPTPISLLQLHLNSEVTLMVNMPVNLMLKKKTKEKIAA